MGRTVMAALVLMLALVLTMGICRAQAPAQKTADFYKGKTVSLLVGSKPGGATDMTARALAPHLSKYLGATVVVQNKTGGAELETMNGIWEAKPDGLTIGCTDFPSLVTNDLHDVPGERYDVEKFGFIGNVGGGPSIIYVSSKSPIKSVQDLKGTKAIKWAATSPSGMRAINLLVTSYLLDLDAKVITGFEGAKEVDLVILRGEATGTSGDVADYRRLIAAGTVRGLFTIDNIRSPGAPDVPAITDLMTFPKEKLTALELMVTLRPTWLFYTPPRISQDLLGFLRKAFQDVTKSSEFRTSIDKVWYPGVPVGEGQTLADRAVEAKKNKKMWQDEFNVLFKKYRG